MSPTTSPQASPSPAAESCTPSGASCRGSCHSLHDTCRPAMHSQQRLVATRERASVVAFSDHAQRSRRRSPRGDTAYRNGPGLVQACARSPITVRCCSALVGARNEPPTTASTEPYDVHDRVPVCAKIHPAMARGPRSALWIFRRRASYRANLQVKAEGEGFEPSRSLHP